MSSGGEVLAHLVKKAQRGNFYLSPEEARALGAYIAELELRLAGKHGSVMEPLQLARIAEARELTAAVLARASGGGGVFAQTTARHVGSIATKRRIARAEL